MQVHYTIASRVFVYVNVELYVHTLMYWRKKKAKLKELSNNISDRSEAKGTGIMSDLLLVDGDVSEANEPDTSGKSALYYIIYPQNPTSLLTDYW